MKSSFSLVVLSGSAELQAFSRDDEASTQVNRLPLVVSQSKLEFVMPRPASFGSTVIGLALMRTGKT